MLHEPDPSRSRALYGRGFSLIELAIVVSIVAVVAAIAIPRLQNASVTTRLATAERLILAELGAQVDTAFAHGRVLTIAFDPEKDWIIVTDGDKDTPDVVLDLEAEPYRVELASADADGNGGSKTTLDPRIDAFPGAITFAIAAGGVTWEVDERRTSRTTGTDRAALGPAASPPAFRGAAP